MFVCLPVDLSVSLTVGLLIYTCMNVVIFTAKHYLLFAYACYRNDKDTVLGEKQIV